MITGQRGSVYNDAEGEQTPYSDWSTCKVVYTPEPKMMQTADYKLTTLVKINSEDPGVLVAHPVCSFSFPKYIYIYIYMTSVFLSATFWERRPPSSSFLVTILTVERKARQRKCISLLSSPQTVLTTIILD